MKLLLIRLEKISAMVGRSVSYLMLLMTVVSVTIVIVRYLFQSGSIAMQDSITYLHATVFIFSMGYCLQQNAHVRVDIFYEKMSFKKKALVDLFGTLFLLLPFSFFTLWVSFPYVQRSWEMGEKSAEAGGLPAIFLLKSLLLVFVFVLIFQAIIEIIKNALILLGSDVSETKNPQGMI
jgi:TRAP-type mannitol/chloroaromatic compound transport system permease small subunit